ncbi:MAG: acetyl-CoA carboxylase carboxyltransferase subunit alpha [Flavobacteriaceae bacterium]|nr:acetyl-CoA carboxylase carboxyltransferase subunit alpha [Flavobacteriaceae bacterium]PHX84503.1 MAG: acetyl-CoA carboxylase carboxyl transferase subunit alpha [Flavobacteriales bacterium]
MEYLDFEAPIRDIDEQIAKSEALELETGVSMAQSIDSLRGNRDDAYRALFANLTAWQRVQLSRHPNRPYTLAYIEAMTGGRFTELHGDRFVKDDKAMVGGWGWLDNESFMFVGQQKGINTKMRQLRNFGMANPDGYRKALRLFKQAEKFGRPIVTLIDTPGAFPGLEAEERGQGEAIARSIMEMTRLKVPVICIIVGEGASGGALGIGVGDRVLMLENTWYSVISPESCSSILWRSWDYKTTAAEALKLTAKDMLSNGLIDGIVPEPLGGAHRDPAAMFAALKSEILKHYRDLSSLDPIDRVALRMEKFSSMGVYENA